MTPDRSGIAGAVRGFANLFEADAFTGRGVMQSYGIAVAMAALIASGRADRSFGLRSGARSDYGCYVKLPRGGRGGTISSCVPLAGRLTGSLDG